MTLRFSKANSGKKVPLTAEEQVMARTLIDAIRKATNKISVAELSRIIFNLDADTLSRLLNQISITGDVAAINRALMESVSFGGVDAIREISRIAPVLALPAFMPTKVQVLNPESLANMDFTKVPRWASNAPDKIKFNLSFNKTNPNSLAFAERRAGELIKSIDEATRQSIRNIITDSFANQVSPQITAMRIKNVIGLHPKWAEAVVEFEKRETARLIKAGVTEAKAAKTAQSSAAAYADRLKEARATTIARTEIQIAQNQGRYEGWKQAADAGYVDPASTKTWITAKDERTCDICGPLDGETVPWLGIFSVGLEAPVVHPNCRCTMVINPPQIASL
jgi:SPP1 gp7 family putative phage head morphogenesis protein